MVRLVNDIKNPFQYPTTMVEKLGKAIIDKSGISDKLAEKFGKTFKEDLTTTNGSALYTTAIASIIAEAGRPKLVAAGLLNENKDIINGKGYNSIKLPKDKLLTASALTENATISYQTEGFDSITVTPSWIGAANRISYEMLHYAMTDLISYELKLIGEALQRKMDSDIISAIDAECTTANGNLITTGGASTRLNYANLVDAIGTVMSAYFEPDTIVAHPEDWAALMKDTDFKQALAYGTVAGAGSVFPMPQQFAGLKIVITTQVASGSTYIVDSKHLGTFVWGSDFVTFDGRIPDTIAFEVIGAVAYGAGIQNVGAVCKIEMSA